MLQSARDPTNTDNRKKVAKSMTILLMSISIAFILLTLPVCIFLLWDRYVFKVVGGDLKFVAKAYLAFSVTHMLWYTNSAVNFLLYCMTASHRLAQI
nr:hypothetical protein BaRGS_021049 [Batillaria attramentaria]